ncbi:siderophore-interacting protein [Rhodococcus sp. P1Y]|uniref:siderophore-interacting protein n=1 Tax=Rhodococcus sp. P1Y TaxID=1302308 RepID=UPI000EB5B749|nr:siderophore-interacting protein [Rhodococcus sp. P1Y]AYJ47178.1 siderophore-interacting protein [Rhodococcus sp. P1Y]
MGRGVEGIIMKAYKTDDYKLTVTSKEPVTDKYIRIGFTGGGLLQNHPVHPTQWVRVWFDDGNGKEGQRGYTLVRQNPEEDTFAIEFAVHYGPASRWAENAEPGDVLEATLMRGSNGSSFTIPDPTPSEFLIFGDTASLPAINTILDAIGDTPAKVWLEWQYDSDVTLPVHAGSATEVTWLQRIDDGRLLREAAEELSPAPGAFAWVACDGRSTRSIVKTLKTNHGFRKESIKSQAYWK